LSARSTIKATRLGYRAFGTVALRKAAKPGEALGVPVDVDLPETEGHYLLCAVRGHD
jgi:hypothetical protein